MSSSQASFSEAAPVASDCPSCAASSSPVEYYGEGTTSVGRQRRESGNAAAEPGRQCADARRTLVSRSEQRQKPAESSVVDPKPEADDATGPEADPEADPATDASTSYEFKPRR